MRCFSCFSSHVRKTSRRTKDGRTFRPVSIPQNKPGIARQRQLPKDRKAKFQCESKNNTVATIKEATDNNITARTFTFSELAMATKNFRHDCLIGEGGFGRVYKGKLEKDGQVVAVKQLDRNGLQGNKEFLVEVLMLSLLHHQNLVNLIGYCADGDQRLLVYDYMPLGSLEDHLLDVSPNQKPLDWFRRMRIALGTAKGLEHLHDKANPPVIYRDLKSSNILLDREFNVKLSDFGLAKLGPMGEKTQVSSRIMGTYGYCAPEYQRTGRLTVKSDVYSFGVVLLELITGRRAIDGTRPRNEENLVSWAYPIFRDPNRYGELADPLLRGEFPARGLNQAVAVSAMCLQEDAAVRPSISDVVSALSFLGTSPKECENSAACHSQPSSSDWMPNRDKENPHDINSRQERQRAVAEAIEWGSNSRRDRAV